jgi:hypothetical protein
MIRLFIGLTLVLMSFLAALETLDGLRAMVSSAGAYRWATELVLAAVVVGAFLHTSRLHRRQLHPRRGQRLLTAGIAIYAVGIAAATGLLVKALKVMPIEQGSLGFDLPALLARLHPQPMLLAAQLLLVVGAFRALSNLVPPAEFEADY